MNRRPGCRFPCTPQHLHAEILDAIFPRDFYDLSFMIVREPVSRVVSEYKWRIRLAKGKELPPIADWFEDARGRYARNPFALDNHIRPQAEFRLDSCEVYRLEDGLDKVYESLCLKLRLGDPGLITGARRNRGTGDEIEVSPELRASIEEFYAVDYEMFGY